MSSGDAFVLPDLKKKVNVGKAVDKAMSGGALVKKSRPSLDALFDGMEGMDDLQQAVVRSLFKRKFGIDLATPEEAAAARAAAVSAYNRDVQENAKFDVLTARAALVDMAAADPDLAKNYDITPDLPEKDPARFSMLAKTLLGADITPGTLILAGLTPESGSDKTAAAASTLGKEEAIQKTVAEGAADEEGTTALGSKLNAATAGLDLSNIDEDEGSREFLKAFNKLVDSAAPETRPYVVQGFLARHGAAIKDQIEGLATDNAGALRPGSSDMGVTSKASGFLSALLERAGAELGGSGSDALAAIGLTEYAGISRPGLIEFVQGVAREKGEDPNTTARAMGLSRITAP